jgi:dolichol-phosphate mannosyltransferase
MSESSRIQTVDIVIPIYNEGDAIRAFHAQLTAALADLPQRFRITYINDGSKDNSQAVLEQLYADNSDLRVVELSRNFGHQAAISAGLDLADSDAVITLDGDGEHPPALIADMLRLAEEGYDIIAAQRREPQKASWFKQATSKAFYWMINRIGDTQINPGAADFRLITRPVLNSLKQFHEYHRFLRGLIAWMGYRSAILPYTPTPRISGQSKYSLKKMLTLATNAIFSFSLVPLYFAISLGGLFILLAIVEAIYVLSFWFSGQQSGLAPGWSSLMFVLLTIGGMIMISLGIIGVYLGYIFQEVKGRPVYLVRRFFDHQNKN